MRIVLVLCSMALLAACYNETGNIFSGTEKPDKYSKYAGIVAKCKVITINDTVQVHFDESTQDTFGIAVTHHFIGTKPDSTEAALFPTEVASGLKSYSLGIYACYTFVVDSNYTGIVVRTPFMNQASSSITLFTLDKVRDTLTDFTEPADQWNVAEETSETISRLYRTNKTKLQAYT